MTKMGKNAGIRARAGAAELAPPRIGCSPPTAKVNRAVEPSPARIKKLSVAATRDGSKTR
jgi:hypothetical protein